jgi:hypothetical protein
MKGSKYGEEARASAITLAQAKGTKTASAETGIPERTIGDWLSDPRYAELRAKTRDDIAEQSKVIAQLAGGEIASRIRAGGFKDTALVMAFGVAIDKLQLLSGGATARTEVRDLGRELSDEELRDALRARLTTPSEDGAAAEAAGAPADSRLHALPD